MIRKVWFVHVSSNTQTTRHVETCGTPSSDCYLESLLSRDLDICLPAMENCLCGPCARRTVFEGLRWYLTLAPPLPKIGFFATISPVYYSAFGHFFHFLELPTMLKTAFRYFSTLFTGRTRTSFVLFCFYYTCFFHCFVFFFWDSLNKEF